MGNNRDKLRVICHSLRMQTWDGLDPLVLADLHSRIRKLPSAEAISKMSDRELESLRKRLDRLVFDIGRHDNPRSQARAIRYQVDTNLPPRRKPLTAAAQDSCFSCGGDIEGETHPCAICRHVFCDRCESQVGQQTEGLQKNERVCHQCQERDRFNRGLIARNWYQMSKMASRAVPKLIRREVQETREAQFCPNCNQEILEKHSYCPDWKNNPNLMIHSDCGKPYLIWMTEKEQSELEDFRRWLDVNTLARRPSCQN